MRIYVDMDDVLCDFSGAHRKSLEAVPELAYPQAEFGFFQNLEPLFGAVDGFHDLEQEFGKVNVHILTRPSIRNPFSYTEKRVWVEKFLGLDACERLNLVPDKDILAGTGILIDDREWSRFHADGMQILFDPSHRYEWTGMTEKVRKLYHED